MEIKAEKLTNILRTHAARPETVVIVQDPAFRSGGILIEDEFDPSGHGVLKVKALASVTSWIEVTWAEATTIVGVQFYGDERGSWGRIKVDNTEVWSGNTNGSQNTFSDYIQISGLPNQPHTVRVEALGQPGVSGGPIFVGVAGVGFGEVSKKNKIGGENEINLPLIFGGASAEE